jgi:hypothetical protein
MPTYAQLYQQIQARLVALRDARNRAERFAVQLEIDALMAAKLAAFVAEQAPVAPAAAPSAPAAAPVREAPSVLNNFQVSDEPIEQPIPSAEPPPGAAIEAAPTPPVETAPPVEAKARRARR